MVSNQPALELVDNTPLSYTQLITHHDEKYGCLWGYMRPQPRSCFTPGLLKDLRRFCDDLVRLKDNTTEGEPQYMVLASDVPGIYNLGGDLDLFRTYVSTGNRKGLLDYATQCVELLWRNTTSFDRDLTTISLVQGNALGGGFECALSANVLVAERGSKMGFPEVLFNLFPGMGAYSFLSRKLDPSSAEKMILSGKVYSAEELHEMGVVDILAEELQGEMAVYDYIKKENRARNGYRAFRSAKRTVNPLTRDELQDITEIWVDAALRLSSRDLRMMERLVARQSGIELKRTLEDRRSEYHEVIAG